MINRYIVIAFLSVQLMVGIFASFTTTFSGRVKETVPPYDYYEGQYDTYVELGYFESPTSSVFVPVWEELFEDDQAVQYTRGFFSINLGESEDNLLTSDVFNNPLLIYRLHVSTLVFDFPLTSLPYAIRAGSAESANSASAENLIEGTHFYGVTTNKGLVVTDVMTVDSNLNKVGIGKKLTKSSYKVDVGGFVNADMLYVNGSPLTNTFQWQSSEDDAANIYNDDKRLFIGSFGSFADNRFDVIVSGALNSDYIFQNGSRLTAALDWIEDEEEHIIYVEDKLVGLGTISPQDGLDILGGIVIGNREDIESEPDAGLIVFDGSDFLGYTGEEWRSLTGVKGSGFLNTSVRWSGSNNLSYSSFAFTIDEDALRFGINSEDPDSQLSIVGTDTETALFYAHTPSVDAFYINPSGNIGIGTTQVRDNSFITVSGNFNVISDDESGGYYLNGLPLRFTLLSGTYFKKNTEHPYIFLDKNYLAIGVPDLNEDLPSNYVNVEIASPPILATDDEVTKDAALTFSYDSNPDDTDLIYYTMGVDADSAGIFRVENSATLGNDFPLFVLQEDRIGLGVEQPDANLHVSGNLGLVVSGSLDNSTANITITGNLFTFIPRRAALIAGNTSESFLEYAFGDIVDYKVSVNIGEASVLMGRDNLVTGLYSTVLGGYRNIVEGTDSSVLGGSNNIIKGYWSLALGERSYVTDHGSFIWSDVNVSTSTSNFASTERNQFLIQAVNGVGINTSETSGSALTIQNKRMYPYDFTSLSSSDDVETGDEIYSELVGAGFITSDGFLTGLHPHFGINEILFVEPISFLVSTSDVYDVLLNGDYPLADTAFTDAVESVVGNSSYSSWVSVYSIYYSKELWQSLVTDFYINDQGEFVSFIPNNTSQFDSKYSDWINVADLSDVLTAYYDDEELVEYDSFQDYILVDLLSEDAFEEWIVTDATPKASQYVWLDLVNRGYIDDEGVAVKTFLDFDELFTTTVFNGETISTENVLSFLTDEYNRLILKTTGVDGAVGLTIQNLNKVGMGYSLIDTAALAVSGSVGINTNTPSSLLHIVNDGEGSTSDMYSILIDSPDVSPTPAFSVTTKGLVGVGQWNPLRNEELLESVSGDIALVVGSGGIYAGNFTLPTGQSLTVSDPVIVWTENGDNIYYVSSNVGIGTLLPGSLLELSNAGDKDPVITFDLDGVDYYSLGIDQDDVGKFKIQPQGTLNSLGGGLSINGKAVGLNTDMPNGSLDVSGSSIVSEIQLVNSADISTEGSLLDVYGLKTDSFFLKNEFMSAAGTKWVPRENATYFTASGSNVGIGTSVPETSLAVSGSMYGDTIYISDNLNIDGSLSLDSLMFDSDEGELRLYVYETELVAESSSITLNISDTLTRGEGLGGPLVVWEDDTVLNTSQIVYTAEEVSGSYPPLWKYNSSSIEWYINDDFDPTLAGTVTVTLNLSISQETEVGNINVGNRIEMGKSFLNAFSTVTNLSYDNKFFTDSQSFDVSSIVINFSDVFESTGTVNGVSIALESELTSENIDAALTKEVHAYGVYSDVSGIQVQEEGPSVRGFKYSALFMGDVGIGINPIRPTPDSGSAVLAVNGTLKATSFNISERLTIVTIDVQSKVLHIAGDANVGINTNTPGAKLEIDGTMTTTTLNVSTGIKMNTLSVQSNNFIVDSTGFVGIGITERAGFDGHTYLYKNIDTQLDEAFIFKKFETTLDDSFDYDITGLDLSFLSYSSSNSLGPDQFVHGIEVDTTALALDDGASVIGLEVIVPTETYSAIFLGGNVGIGTTEPQATLHVIGTLYATNVPDIDLSTEQNGGEFSYLAITDSVSLGLNGITTINNLLVDTLSLDAIGLEGLVSLNVLLDVGDLIAGDFLVAGEVTASSLIGIGRLNADSGKFDTLTLGESTLREGLVVDDLVETDTFLITDSLTSSRLRVNTNQLSVSSAGYVGIGTSTPYNKLSVQFSPSSTFSASNNESWNAVKLQSDTSIENGAVGVWMNIENSYDEDEAPVGFVALRETSATSTGSSLVLVGNTESIWIAASGNIGLGTSEPEHLLHIVGNGLIESKLSIRDGLNTDKLAGDIITINSPVFSETTVNATVIGSERHVSLKQSNEKDIIDGYLQLYISDANELIFKTVVSNGDIVTASISDVLLGTDAFTIPYYDDNHTLASSPIKWVTGNVNTLIIGSDDSVKSIFSDTAVVHHTASISSDVNSPQVLKSLALQIPRRDTSSSYVFSGLDINSNADLSEDDVVVGLSIDVSDLIATSDITIDGDILLNTEGTKLSALFRGGKVGVFINPNGSIQPSASLHIQSYDGEDALSIVALSDANVTGDAVHMKNSGQIGLGTTLPTALLHVVGDDDTLLNLNSGGDTFLGITQTSVLIGTSTGNEALDVSGTLIAEHVTLGGLLSEDVSFNAGGFILSDSGKIGLQVDDPTAFFEINNIFSNSLASPFTQQSINLVFNSVVTKDVTGLSFNFSSAENNSFSSEGRVVGFKIDVTGLEKETNSIVKGISLHVSDNMDELLKSAEFMGGYVGIGTTSPSVELDVIGTIIANNFVYQGDLGDISTSGGATVNNIVVGGDYVGDTLKINSDMSILIRDLTFSQQSSTFDITAADFETVVFTVLNRLNSNYIVIPTLSIGTTDRLADVTVSGNSNINGALTGISSLTLSEITSNVGIVVNATSVEINASVNIANELNASYVNLKNMSQDGLLFTDSDGVLFVNSDENNDLYYIVLNEDNNPVSANLTNLIRGEISKVPYFDESGLLGVNSFMSWEAQSLVSGDDAFVFKIGTQNLAYSLNDTSVSNIESYFSATETSSPTMEKIQLSIAPRLEASSSIFNGVKVVGEMTSLSALHEDDVFIGVNINLSNLENNFTQDVEGTITQFENGMYSALFNGGFVGIVIDDSIDSFIPSVNLHIQSYEEQDGFRVVANDSNGVTRDSLIVKNSGQVGIGTISPTAVVSVKGIRNEPIISLISSANSSIFYIDDNGVAIGTTAVSGELTVQDELKGSLLDLNGLTADEININSDGFVVDADGKIGLQTESPTAYFEIQKTFNSALTVPYSQQYINLNLDDVITKDLQGIGINIESLNSDGLSSIGSATGMKIDFTSFIKENQSVIQGVSITVSNNIDSSLNSAILLGGDVGVGTTQPDSKMDVIGTVSGRNFYYNNDFGNLESLAGVTVNNLNVTSLMTFDTLDLGAGSLSVNHLTFTTQTNLLSSISASLDDLSFSVLGQLNADFAYLSNVGIGTSNTSGSLTVSGNAIINGELVVSTVTVNAIESLESIAVNASSLVVNNGLSITSNALSVTYLQLSPLPFDDVTDSGDYGLLFTNSDENNDLYYIYNNGTVNSGNMSSFVEGNPTSLLYFNDDNHLVESDHFVWETQVTSGGDDIATLRIGTSNESFTLSDEAIVSIQSLFGATESSSPTHETVKMTIAKRESGSSSVFSGVQISGTADTLKTDDVFIGIGINLSDLERDFTQEVDGQGVTQFTNSVYAALFNGGKVGIAIDNPNDTFVPSNNIHILNNASEDGFRVQAQNSDGIVKDAIIVKNSGLVGIGSATPNARLLVVGESSQPILNISTVTKDGLYIDNEGLSIGTTLGNEAVEVSGTVVGDDLVLGGLNADEINIKSGVFTVDLDQKIGINADVLDANFNVQKTFDTPLSESYYQQRINQRLDTVITKNITGFGVSITSLDDNSLGGSGSATGLSINLSSLSKETQSKVVGISSVVSANMDDSFTSALFLGGLVGIGTSEPQVELDVVGLIKGDNFLHTGSFSNLSSIVGATVNRMYVDGNVYGGILDVPNQTVRVQSLTFTNQNNIFEFNLEEIQNLQFSVLQRLNADLVVASTMNIGTDITGSDVTVSGNTVIQGTLTSSGVSISSIEASPNLVINSTSVIGNAGISFVGDSLSIETLKLIPIADTEITGDSDYGQVYVNSGDGNLYYVIGESTDTRTENISGLYTGNATSSLYFDGNGSLIGDADLRWITESLDSGTIDKWVIGTGNSTVALKDESVVHLISYISEEESGDLIHDAVSMTIGKRITAGTSVFKGVDIVGGGSTFIDGDIFVGVSVSLNGLERGYTQEVEGAVTVYDNNVYAGLFRGGRVGIGINNNGSSFAPSTNVAVHIRSNDGEDGLLVSANESENVSLIVKNSGLVGLGTTTPGSKLTIVGNGDAQLRIESESGEGYLIVSENVGIGITNPSKELEIVGRLGGTTGLFVGLEAITANIGSGVFVVNAAGQVGFNTATPEADFHAYKLITENLTVGYIEELVSVNVRVTNNVQLAGLDINLNSETNNSLKTGQVAVGLDIDLSSLEINEGSTGIGINSVVGSGMFAGLFEGGYVGIGTTEPGVALSVVGTVSGNNFEYTSGLGSLSDVEDVTVNTLIVDQGAVFEASVIDMNSFVSNLYISNLRFNSITASLNLNESALSNPTLNITDFLTSLQGEINQVWINTENAVEALALQGEGIVTGTMTLTGEITANRLESDSHLSFSQNITINQGIALDGLNVMNVNTLRLDPVVASSISGDDDYGQVYVNNSDGNLYYVIGESTDTRTENISGLYTGNATSFLYFDGTGGLVGDSDLRWVTESLDSGTIDKWVIGTGNSTVTLKDESVLHLISYISEEESGDLIHDAVSMTIGKRISAGTSVFKGVDIVGGGSTFIDGDIFVGVSVSLNGLERGYTQEVEGAVTVYDNKVYAGVFRGGRVGIGINNNGSSFAPSTNVAVHIRSNDGEDGLLVSANESENVSLIVKNSGLVGLGTTTPGSKLTIVGNGDAQLRIESESGEGYLIVSENVGIGITNPSKELEIVGRLGGTTGLFKGLESITANIGSGVFVVTDAGRVGFNTATPEADFHAYKLITENLTVGYIEELVSVNVRVTNNVQLAGLDINLNSETNNSLKTGQVAVGLDIDLSSLEINEGSTGIGINSVVGSGMVAGLFEGGYVGIGTTEPGVALGVVGTVSGNNFQYTSGLGSLGDVEDVTVNTLIVDQGAVFGDFVIDVSSISTISVTSTLQFETLISSLNLTESALSKPTLNITSSVFSEVAMINYVLVNTDNMSASLNIVGNGIVTGSVTVASGATVNVNAISSEESILVDTNLKTLVPINVDNGFTVLSQSLQLPPMSSIPSSMSAYGQLFSNGLESSDLYYLITDGSDVRTENISGLSTGNATSSLYFDENGSLIGASDLRWVTELLDSGNIDSGSIDKWVIGTGNSTVALKDESIVHLKSYISEEESGDLIHDSVSMTIGKRITAGTSVFKGVDIVGGGSTFIDGDKFVGVSVSLNGLERGYTQEVEGEVIVYDNNVYAGVFRGGRVGIGINSDRSSFAPSTNVAVHIRSNDGEDGFIVSANESENVSLIVKNSGFVGIGTTTPGSKLTIVGNGEAQLRIESESGEAYLVVSENVGIGITNPSKELEVVGRLGGTTGLFEGLESITANIGSGVFVVTEAGKVGFNTAAPEADFHAYKKITENLTVAYIEELVSVKVSSTNNINLAGLDINLNSDTNNSLKTGKVAIGLDIDLSSLEINEGSTGIGINSVVGSGMFAGLFEGGYVGIGTTEPGVALSVVGTIRASNFSYLSETSSSNLGLLDTLTVDDFYVAGDTQFGEFNVDASGQTVIVEDLTFTNQTTPIDFTVNAGDTSNLKLGNSAIATTANMDVISVNGASTANLVLAVEGDGRFYETLFMQGASSVITTNAITSDDDLYINTNVSINSQLDITGGYSLSAGYYEIATSNTSEITATATYGQLFVDEADNNLYYTIISNSETITGNISSLGSGTVNRVPYLGANNVVTTDGYISYYPNVTIPDSSPSALYDMFVIGTENTESVETLVYKPLSSALSYIGTDDKVDEDFSAIDVQFLFPRRLDSDNDDSKFYGLHVHMNAAASPNEIYVGLDVTMNIVAESTTERAEAEDSVIKGYKVAAVFMGGAVGISATNDATIVYPSANVIIYNKTAESNPLLVGESDDVSPYFLLDATGNITLGSTVNSGVKLKVIGDDAAPEFTIYDQNNDSILTVDDSYVSLFSDSLDVATFYVNASDLASVFRIDTEFQDNVVNINDDGDMGIYTDNPESTLHLVSDGVGHSFSVNSGATTGLLVSGNNVLIGTSSLPDNGDYLSLIVQSRLAIGVDSNSLLPTYMTSGTTPTFNGILGTYGPLMYGMGMISHSDTDDDAQFIYGGSSTQNSFVIQGYSKVKGGDFDMLTFDSDADVGVHVADPKANLHVSGYNNENYFLVEPSANNKNLFFVIDDNNNIGLNVISPAYSFQVSGDAKFDILEDAPNGTVLNASSLFINSKESTGNNATMRYVQTVGDVGHTMYTNTMTLNHDHFGYPSENIDGDIVGIDIRVSSNSGGRLRNSSNTTGNAYGLFVDMRDLIVNDATFGDEIGKLYAATFFSATDSGSLDTFVGIGTSTPEASLEVQSFTFESNGIPSYNPTGNIAYFESTPNVIDGLPDEPGSALLIFGNNTVSSNRKYNYYTEPVANIVPTAALMAIVYEQEAQTGEITTIYVDWSAATQIMGELISDGVLNNEHQLVSGWEDNFGADSYYATSNFGYAIPSQNIIDILMNFKRRPVIGLSVFDLDFPTVTYNPITLASGFTGKPEENAFIGTVGINMYDSLYDYPEYNLNDALAVSGDIRLGIVKAVDGQRDSPGGEPAIYFSGGPELYPDEVKDSENEDVMFMQRRNYDENISQLMVSIGDSNKTRADVRFSIGSTIADGSGIKLTISVSSENADYDYKLTTTNVSYDDAKDFLDGWYAYITSPNIDDTSIYSTYYISAGNVQEPENPLDAGVAGFDFAEASVALEYEYDTAGGALLGNPAASTVFDHAFTVRAYAHDSDDGQYEETGGYVGIGTSEPGVPLHVVGDSRNASDVNAKPNGSIGDMSFLVKFDNTSTAADKNSLMINYSATVPYSDSNFITFLARDASNDDVLSSLGSIEGNDNGDGVQFVSPERDYAEYIPKLDKLETIESGDVVGIFQGKLSKETMGADQIMVISSSPIVIGNWPGKKKEKDFGLVAFLGQVPVKVQGPVNKGDYIVASGKSDGTAIALSEDKLTSLFIDSIVGRALDSSEEMGIVRIDTIIGFPFGQSQIERNISKLRLDLDTVKTENNELETLLKERVEKRKKLIESLKSDMVSK